MTRTYQGKRDLVWTDEGIDVLISLYGENMNKFMNPEEIQATLWKKLSENMKNDQSLPKEFRNDVTPVIVHLKWIGLQRSFKRAFYGSSDRSLFPFYHKMNQLFNDYATKHLNEIDSSKLQNNESFKDEVTSTVMDLLYNENTSLLRRQLSRDATKIWKPQNIKIERAKKSSSEALKVLNDLVNISEDSLSVQETKMTIVPNTKPNTPFNRHCQLSTIPNQHIAFSSFKRSYNGNDIAARKKPTSTFIPLNDDISAIIPSSLDSFPDSFEHDVEASNDFDITEITYPAAKRVDSEMEVTFTNEKTSLLEVPSINPGSIADPTKFIPKKLTWKDENDQTNNEPPTWFSTFLMQYNSDVKGFSTKLKEIDDKVNKVLEQRPLITIKPFSSSTSAKAEASKLNASDI